jgi:glycosyltransferase involved in cell wall biosynthesis
MKVCYYLCDQAKTRKSRGIWVYTSGLMNALVKQNSLEMIAVTSLDGPQIIGVENFILPVRTGSIPKRLVIDQIHPLMMPKAELYHYPKGFMPFFSRKRAPEIASVLDTIVVHYNDNYRGKNSIFKPFELDYWIASLNRTLRQADGVITISHKSAELILDYCDRRGIKPPPVFVTYLASKYHDDLPENVFKSNENYVMHFASELPHKRTDWLLETWRRMELDGIDLPHLLLIGSLSRTQRQVAESIRGLKVLPYLNDEQLKDKIVGARALIYPSEIEGFGLPALEAYQLGTPAMYVAKTSVDEIMKVNRIYVPGCFHFDYDDFKRALFEILDVSTEAISMIQKKMYEMYNWENTAKQTLSAYNRILKI